MNVFDIILIGIGLAMDCFAVSICFGLLSKKLQWKYVLRLAAFFGGFQAGMPILGWLIGMAFKDYIAQFDHWIAFALLGAIGIKMIIGAINKKDDTPCIQFNRLSVLLSLSIATSIDALIIGMGFAFLQVNIWLAIGIIGIISAGFTILGSVLGKKYGKYLGKRAEIVGGIVLVAIGIKILLEHMLFS
jgi:putative Mn2+ efflux pump MntP